KALSTEADPGLGNRWGALRQETAVPAATWPAGVLPPRGLTQEAIFPRVLWGKEGVCGPSGRCSPTTRSDHSAQACRRRQACPGFTELRPSHQQTSRGRLVSALATSAHSEPESPVPAVSNQRSIPRGILASGDVSAPRRISAGSGSASAAS